MNYSFVPPVMGVKGHGMRSLKHLFVEPVESTLLQVPRALFASSLAAALDVGCLIVMVEFWQWHPAAAAFIGYLAGMIVQYGLCLAWVFPAAPENNAGFVPFALFSLVGLGITWVLIATLTDFTGMPYMLAKLVALGVAFSWNFLSRKWVLFRSQSLTPHAGEGLVA